MRILIVFIFLVGVSVALVKAESPESFRGGEQRMRLDPMRSSKAVPEDLRIEGTAGGMHPWEENHSLLITADGHGKYTRYISGRVGVPPIEESEFTLTATDLTGIWNAIKEHNFLSLEPEYVDEKVTGGSFATLTITAEGITHRVDVQNVALPPFEALLRTINAATPPGKDLIYR
jgi:hypothetical protein